MYFFRLFWKRSRWANGLNSMNNSILNQSEFIKSTYEIMIGLRTPYEFYALLKATATKLDFHNYAVLHLPKEQDQHIRPAFIATNWPPELIAEYDQNKLLRNSPIMSRLRASPDPVLYDIETMAQSRPKYEMALVRDLFTLFKIPRGVYFPCHDGAGRKGAVAFMGERSLPSGEEIALLHLLCHYAYSHMHLLLAGQGENQPLKPREIECLELAALGRTNGECATLLKVSETTISGYFASIGRKLSARNKPHMVAIAYERDLIHPNVMRPTIGGQGTVQQTRAF